MTERTALVVDDDIDGQDLIGRRLREVGFDVHAFGDAYLALEYVREFPPDIVVTDHFLPGMLGSYFVERLREFSDVPIIGLSARASIEICVDMHRAGAQRFIEYESAVDRIGEIAAEVIAAKDFQPPLMTVTQARARRDDDEQTRFSSLVAAFDGNISAIARHMDVDRSTVQYHLTRLGLR